jgi:hypothetical protein
MKVNLDYAGSESSWFIVQPFYKLRSNGDKVLVNDRIVLQSFVAMQPLHVSESELLDNPGYKEVYLADLLIINKLTTQIIFIFLFKR